MLTMYFDNPIQLSGPKYIQSAITEALEEQKEVIAEEFRTRAWSEVQEVLHGVAKQRFFERLINRLPSTLQWKAEQSVLMSRAVTDFHMKYKNLDIFLVSLNYFLGQQADLENFRYTNRYSDKFHDLPQTAPERSALYNFMTSLTKT
jgi:hypothetical protein